MNNEKQLRQVPVSEKISISILFFLMLVRLADQYIPELLFGKNTPILFTYWYAAIAYVLTCIIVWLNRNRLPSLNVDKPFVVILILGGAVSMLYMPMDIAIFVGVVVVFFFWALNNDQFNFSDLRWCSSKTFILIWIAIVPTIVPLLLYSPSVKTIPDMQSIINTLLQTQLAGIVFEELLFRGMLWSYLRGRGINQFGVFIIQTVLFWISHHRYLLLHNPYAFWISVPFESILFGVIVWRSKSVTPSTIAHFLVDFTAMLVNKVF
jgi:hypothetical protein